MNSITISYPKMKWMAAWLMLACLLGIIQGCAPAESGPAVPATSTLAAPTTAPTETEVPTVTPTPFIPKATLKIAVHAALSGDMGQFGQGFTRAAEIALQDLSLPLEQLGYAVELATYDDLNDIDAAVTNANQIVADNAILCGVGHFTSRMTIQATEIYRKAGLAFISPSSTMTTVTDRGYFEVNRVIGREDGQGQSGALFAKDQGFSTVYMLSQQGSNYAQKNADYFKRKANQIGLTVVGEITTSVTNDFESLVTRVMTANPDVVYFATTDIGGQVGPFIRQARAAGYLGAILGPDGLDNPALIELAGPLALDGGGLYYSTTAAPAAAYPGAAGFITDYDVRYASAPPIFAAQAYDATGVCLQAIEDASLSNNGEIPTRKAVSAALRDLVDYPGITGTFSFNDKGDPTLASYFIFKVNNADPGRWGENSIVASYQVEPPN